jgi:hypothetical protein
MRDLSLKDHIIGIAKILKVTEKEVMQVIYDAFENTSDEADVILDDAYWEFQDDNKSPDLKRFSR